MKGTTCQLFERIPVDGGHRYEHVDGNGEHGYDLRLPEAPAVGDFVSLPGGSFRVVARAWLPTHYGSTNWPYGKAEPEHLTMMSVILERAEGLFADEVVDPEEDPANG